MKIVSIRECDNYIYEQVKESFNILIKDIGGLENHIKKNSKVLIKANLLMKKSPEEAATTHPMVVKVVAEELLKLGCDVTIGDSPGGPYNERSLKSVYKACGMEAVANELKIKLNYDTSEIKVENPNGKMLKYLSVIKPIVDSDYVINVCKLKTHVLATYTGGVKNLFGVIAGTSKAEYHMRMPKIEDFSEALVDICEYVKPTLTIIDGIIGMEGEGPSGGDPRKIGVLMASNNPYALDVVACKVINLDPKKVPTIERAMERGLLRNNLSDVKIMGSSIERNIIKDFKIPDAKHRSFGDKTIPKFVTKSITPKPVVRKKDCVGCAQCEIVCPAKAITMINKKPQINLDICIRCYCCHELCPKKAIDVKRPFIFKIIK